MRIISILLLLLISLSCSKKQENAEIVNESTAFDSVAMKPPMGWNSWNSFGTDVTEKEIRANADYMAQHLKEFGWEYIVVDLGWYITPDLNVITFKAENPEQTLDEYGRLLPDVRKFPSANDEMGFKTLADYVHGKGLKFGIHIMRGIPWQAVEQNMPIKGTEYHAQDIVNRNDTCVWYDGLYGVDMSKPGAQEYYNSIVELYAEWGVDYIKADDMSYPYHGEEINGLHNAIVASGRPIVLSLSPGAAPLDKVDHLRENANLWRISPDFWDDWKFLKKQFDLCRDWQKHVTPNHWPDADMLPLGKLRVTGSDDYVAGHMGKTPAQITNEYSRFTDNEKYTLMTLWSIFRSPLMMGGHLPDNDSITLALLTNDEVLAVNQHSINNRELKASNGLIVWTADVPGSDDKYVAFFNINDSGNAEVGIDWSEIGLEGELLVRDLWTKKDLGLFNQKFSSQVPPHGAGLYRVATK